MSAIELLSDLQCNGLKWEGEVGLSRKGGAGPSDHKAMTLSGQTLMIPVLNLASQDSPYTGKKDAATGEVIVFKNRIPVATLTTPTRPRRSSASPTPARACRALSTCRARACCRRST